MVHDPVLNNFRRVYRRVVFDVVYQAPPAAPIVLPDLTRLADTIGNLSLGPQTAFVDGHNAANGDVGLLERQVSRAITQVLGPLPGQGPDTFTRAVSAAFPITQAGQLGPVAIARPSSYRAQANGTAAGAGLSGQITAAQANLQRQAAVIVEDAVGVLDTLTPLTQSALGDQVKALQTVVRNRLKEIVDEFGYVGEPRFARVDAAFDALINPRRPQVGVLAELGRVAAINLPGTPPTVADETRNEALRLLNNYVTNLQGIWNNYRIAILPPPPPPGGFPAAVALTERVARASRHLPAVSMATTNLLGVLDSVGLTEGERRSDAARLSSLVPAIPPPPPRGQIAAIGAVGPLPPAVMPPFTFGALTDWLLRFGEVDGPSLLADADQDGFDSVMDQSHELFVVLALVVYQFRTVNPVNRNIADILPRSLADERVGRTLDDIVFQVRTLADLAPV